MARARWVAAAELFGRAEELASMVRSFRIEAQPPARVLAASGVGGPLRERFSRPASS